MPFRIDFKDVLLAGTPQSWTCVMPTFGPRELIAHLEGRGMSLKCGGTARHPDEVICDEWDEDACDGRILRASSRLIGRFRVRHVTDAQAELLFQELERAEARETEEMSAETSAEMSAETSAEADATAEMSEPAPEMEATPEAEESLDRLCIRMGIRRGFPPS